jgi:hypothetical protein
MKSRNIKESVVEKLLVQSVRTLRGLCFKLKFIGIMGAPDRLVLMPGGRFFFVELKQLTGELEPSQEILFPRLEKRGFKVHILYGVEQVEQFIETYLKATS